MTNAARSLAPPGNRMIVLARDYAELTKGRVTTLIVMTAWCGYYFGAVKLHASRLEPAAALRYE